MKKSVKKAAALLLAALMTVSLCGCETYNNFKAAFFERNDEPVIYFGVFEPLTGQYADDAKEEIRGIELAHDLYGQALGCRIDLLYSDNGSEVETARTAASALVESKALLALGSYQSILSMAGGDVFKEAGLPAIGISCKNPLVTSTNDYYSRVCFIDSYEGDSAARYVYTVQGKTNVAVFKQKDDDYADILTEQFEATMSDLTGDDYAVSVIEYQEGIENFTPYLLRLKLTGCDTVFYPSSAKEADRVLQIASSSIYDFNWIGTSQWAGIENVNQNYGQSGDYYLDGINYIVDYDEKLVITDQSRFFIEKYKAKYGDDAVPTEAAALGYDAYMMAYYALLSAGTVDNRQAIAENIKRTQDYQGVTGVISLNAQGDPIKEVTIEQVRKTNVDGVFTVSPETTASVEALLKEKSDISD